MQIMSTLAFRGMLDELVPIYRSRFGADLEFQFDPTAVMMARIQSGERADVALLTAKGIDELSSLAILASGSKVDIANSQVGLAVKSGASKPNIATPAAARAALLSASSVAYSRTGASGIFFASVIERLGIADAINSKAKIIESGFTAELAADGRAEIAVQQISELMVIPGVDVVGALPDPLQERLTFSGGVFVGTKFAGDARNFLEFLASQEFSAKYRSKGLLPIAG